MPYNRYIGYPAPLPSGALPTEAELTDLLRQSRQHRLSAIAAWFRRLMAR